MKALFKNSDEYINYLANILGEDLTSELTKKKIQNLQDYQIQIISEKLEKLTYFLSKGAFSRNWKSLRAETLIKIDEIVDSDFGKMKFEKPEEKFYFRINLFSELVMYYTNHFKELKEKNYNKTKLFIQDLGSNTIEINRLINLSYNLKIERIDNFKFKTEDWNKIIDLIDVEYEKTERILKTKPLLTSNISGNSLSLKSNLQPKQIDELYKKLLGNFIAENTPQELFEKVFTNQPLNDLQGQKIKWIESLALFICLIYGTGEPKRTDDLEPFHFPGLIKQEKNIHKKILECFEFTVSTNNKDLSSKINRLNTQNTIRGLNNLLPILKSLKGSR